jgi:hypothetical protein
MLVIDAEKRTDSKNLALLLILIGEKPFKIDGSLLFTV